MKPFSFWRKGKGILPNVLPREGGGEKGQTCKMKCEIPRGIRLFMVLFAALLLGWPAMAVIPGSKVGVFVQCLDELRGPLSYSMNSTATGFVEPLPIINFTETHHLYAYWPYDASTSTDPTQVQVTPIPYLQTQSGTSNSHQSHTLFYVGNAASYDIGDRPLVQFMHGFTSIEYLINTNVNDLIVDDIILKAPDGAVMSFTGATVNVTLRSNHPDFARLGNFQGGNPGIALHIADGGLPVPNSVDDYARGFITINPGDLSGEKLEITVKTNMGDFVFEENGQNFVKATAYEIKLRIDLAEPEVGLQWSVSTTTADPSSFTDVDNDELTVANAPGPVYLQIRPETENLEYDSWDVDYTAVPANYMYPVTVPIAEGERLDFNEGNPHRVSGTYTYTVDRIRFYKAGSEVHSVSFDDEPYKHTIRINQEEPPAVNVSFQWSVSTTTNGDDAYGDVRNNTTTQVTEPVPVFLRIRPVVEGPLDYDRWEITYTAEPAEYEYPVTTPLTAGSPYDFNQGNAHVQTGSYIYTVGSYTFYKEGRVVMDGWGFYRHTIIIDPSDDPGPPGPPDPPGPDPEPDPWPPVLPPDPPVIEPDPNPDSWIFVRPGSPLCYMDMEYPVSFVLQYKEDPLEYAVVFTDAAKAAGFEDDSTFTALPENGLITIPVNGYVPKGIYYGYLVLRIKGTADTDLFPFRIQVMDYVRITEQPQPVGSRCEGDGFTLRVETEGDVLSYQWYLNREIIPGATDSVYHALLAEETVGDYYVEVSGYCNTETSDTVRVGMNTLHVEIKWTDVLYVTNTDGRYVSFQWYRDGQAIAQHGTSVYYTDPAGLLGEYHVRAVKADGSFEESCPLTFGTLTKAADLTLYPSPVERHASFTVEGEELQGARIDVYDLYGRLVTHTKASGTVVDMTAPAIGGHYFVRVTLSSGKTTTLRLMVKE